MCPYLQTGPGLVPVSRNINWFKKKKKKKKFTLMGVLSSGVTLGGMLRLNRAQEKSGTSDGSASLQA